MAKDSSGGYKVNDLTEIIIGSAIEVHKNLGPGLLESAYQQAMAYEFADKGIKFLIEKPIPVKYKGRNIDCAFRADMVVEDAVIIELKAVDKLMPIHTAQLITYLKLSGLKVGLLINFNVGLLKNGIKRVIV